MAQLNTEAFSLDEETRAQIAAQGITITEIDAPWDVQFVGSRESLEWMIRSFWADVDDEETAAEFIAEIKD
jgi:hypothetical protein